MLIFSQDRKTVVPIEHCTLKIFSAYDLDDEILDGYEDYTKYFIVAITDYADFILGKYNSEESAKIALRDIVNHAAISSVWAIPRNYEL